ncbi:MAG: hypothetical protein AUG09_02395 [Acidobacteria bacterium 13_1_20CM_2_68_7]|nr:MAG: hypothetical protein AUG09_02395 [Acidobacteria bacterium 13_1_20CM_2_68_7]
MKRILCLALFAALALGAPVFAANAPEKTGEIGFDVAQANVNSDSTGIDSAQFLGVRGGFQINKQFQIEGQVATSSENGSISGTDVDTKMRLYMVNGVMNFHPRKKEYVPYLMAGIGQADIQVDSSGTSASDNSMAYQIGGGTRIYFGKTQRMAFRTDVSLLRETTFSDSTTFTTVTAGMTWKLGGR